jgi:hypothetical protein
MDAFPGHHPSVTIITQAASRGQYSQFRGLSAAHENGQKNNSPTSRKRDRHNQRRVIHLHLRQYFTYTRSEVKYG